MVGAKRENKQNIILFTDGPGMGQATFAGVVIPLQLSSEGMSPPFQLKYQSMEFHRILVMERSRLGQGQPLLHC